MCRGVEVPENDADGTVTFVATPRNENPGPDTEWVTAAIDDVLDPTEQC